MVTLELSTEEADLLKDIFQSYFNDLRMEISHTDSMDFRDYLKSKEALLRRLMHELDEVPA
ncbi:MAG: hypothetical protein LCH54_01770 [Bacteroidetes bacterium]|nr:hypothetical protein [Bacteroidota bacterium]MCA0444936.1 hypothetical protein [Bacteroidota bacterium]